MIYPVDSVNQPLNNWALMYNLAMVDPYISKFCFPSSACFSGIVSGNETRTELRENWDIPWGRSYGDLWSSYQSFSRGLSNCFITDSRAFWNVEAYRQVKRVSLLVFMLLLLLLFFCVSYICQNLFAIFGSSPLSPPHCCAACANCPKSASRVIDESPYPLSK